MLTVVAKNRVQPPSYPRLTGQALLLEVARMGQATQSDLLSACGYLTKTRDGRKRYLYNDFYEAFLEAKNISIERDSCRSEIRSKLSFIATVNASGTLLIGGPYTKAIGAVPGSQFDVILGRGNEIVLCGRRNSRDKESAPWGFPLKLHSAFSDYLRQRSWSRRRPWLIDILIRLHAGFRVRLAFKVRNNAFSYHCLRLNLEAICDCLDVLGAESRLKNREQLSLLLQKALFIFERDDRSLTSHVTELSPVQCNNLAHASTTPDDFISFARRQPAHHREFVDHNIDACLSFIYLSPQLGWIQPGWIDSEVFVYHESFGEEIALDDLGKILVDLGLLHNDVSPIEVYEIIKQIDALASLENGIGYSCLDVIFSVCEHNHGVKASFSEFLFAWYESREILLAAIPHLFTWVDDNKPDACADVMWGDGRWWDSVDDCNETCDTVSGGTRVLDDLLQEMLGHCYYDNCAYSDYVIEDISVETVDLGTD